MAHNQYTNPTSYPDVLARMVEELGVDVEWNGASVEAMRKRIGASDHAVQFLRSLAERTGGMRVRYSGRTVDGHIAGRVAHWTFIHDAAWIAKKAKELWGVDLTNTHTFSRMPIDGRFNPKNRDKSRVVVGEPPKTRETHVEPVVQTTEDTVVRAVGEEAPSPFEALRPALKNDEEAIIAAAQQYRNRSAFIDQELSRFAEMGIEIDRSAIKFHEDERLEAVVAILDYVERIKAANERMTARVQASQPRIQSQVEADLRRELEALRAERATRDTATEALVTSYRLRIQALERQIREAGGTPVKTKAAELTQPLA